MKLKVGEKLPDAEEGGRVLGEGIAEVGQPPGSSGQEKEAAESRCTASDHGPP